MRRIDNRAPDELRPINIVRNYNKYAEGSVFIECGDTRVICTATIEDRVPPFLRGTGQGWVTAEYSMLPRATATRNVRDAARGKIGGRTHEIQRMIGRALRSVVDLKAIGERTIWLDCDVIQADGGTRTTSVTGAYVALADALYSLMQRENRSRLPLTNFVASTSAGIVDGEMLLDMCFAEDSKAQVDMNLVMTGDGRVIEIQGTAEEFPFTRRELDQLIALAEKGIMELITIEKEVLSDEIVSRIGGKVGHGISLSNQE